MLIQMNVAMQLLYFWETKLSAELPPKLLSGKVGAPEDLSKGFRRAT